MTLRHVNGRTYYYKSVRKGDRVRSVYQGAGEAARLIAEIERIETIRKRLLAFDESLLERARCRKAQRLQARVDRYCRRVDALWRAEMAARGYHQHGRSAWRKRRMSTEVAVKDVVAAPPAPTTWAEVQDVTRKAAKGDRGALASLRGLLRSEWRPKIVAWCGDLSRHVNDALIEKLAGSAAAQETLRAGVEDVRRDATPPDASPLERLLAGRIATTWLAVHVFEHDAATPGNATPRVWEMKQRLADRANRRFLASVKALAALRRTGPETLVQVINRGDVRVG